MNANQLVSDSDVALSPIEASKPREVDFLGCGKTVQLMQGFI